MRTIQISESIKQEIAEKVAAQQSAGYSVDAQGRWYVVDGTAVMHKQRNASWSPWHDDADVIEVEDLVNIFGGADDYEAAVDFALGYVPDNYDAEAYENRYA